ncbi:MAG: LamG domain-containing protein [Planctomycetes bacterium]|nr:LamG domain-containing protein [Planctomycetota bacterium]
MKDVRYGSNASFRYFSVIAVCSLLVDPLASVARAQPASLQLADQAYVRLSNSTQMAPQQFTIEARFRADGPGYGHAGDSAGATIIAKPREGGSGSYIMSWALDWSATTQKAVFILTHAYPSQGVAVSSSSRIAQGSPAHVAVTFDGVTIRMYLNGQLDSYAAFGYSGVYYSSMEPVLIGAGNYDNGYLRRWQGMIDDVRVWNHVRTRDQIAESASCEPQGNEPGLLAAYDFTDQRLTDRSPNGSDGIAQGTVAFGPQAPSVLSPPRIEAIDDQLGCVGSTVQFSADASGSPPLAFAWQIADSSSAGGWRTLADGPVEGPPDEVMFIAAGSDTETLTLANLWGGGTGEWSKIRLRVNVINTCGSATSNPYDLQICAGDFNCDGGVDGGDVDAFFTVWESGGTPADLNLDGGVDGADVQYFYAHWEAGC